MSITSIPITVLMASLGVNPVGDAVGDQVDLMELNHFYDEQGKHVFDQIIFYDWSSRHRRYNIRAWRLLKRRTQLPERAAHGRGFVTVWHDPKASNVLRKVCATSLRETWTQYDPELFERRFLPQNQRRELLKIVNNNAVAVR